MNYFCNIELWFRHDEVGIYFSHQFSCNSVHFYVSRISAQMNKTCSLYVHIKALMLLFHQYAKRLLGTEERDNKSGQIEENQNVSQHFAVQQQHIVHVAQHVFILDNLEQEMKH